MPVGVGYVPTSLQFSTVQKDLCETSWNDAAIVIRFYAISPELSRENLSILFSFRCIMCKTNYIVLPQLLSFFSTARHGISNPQPQRVVQPRVGHTQKTGIFQVQYLTMEAVFGRLVPY